MLRRRSAIGLAVSASVASPGIAQTWPSRTVRYIVPFAPGGGTDTVSRIVADQLSQLLGQQVIVDNRGGAGGNIGTAELARATPDGHTIGLISVASHSINPTLYATLPYDPDKDLIAVSLLASLPNLLTVNLDLPVRNVAELVALLKKEPGKYAFASSGLGSSLHLSGEMFKAMAGVDMLHIPYKGAGAAFPDIMAGRVHMIFSNAPSALAQVRGGKLRGLAFTSAERSKTAPEIPTIAETIPGYVATSWYGLGLPAGTPEPIVAKLEAALTQILAKPDIQSRWFEMGLDVPPTGRAAAARFIAEERARWAPVIKASGAKIE